MLHYTDSLDTFKSNVTSGLKPLFVGAELEWFSSLSRGTRTAKGVRNSRNAEPPTWRAAVLWRIPQSCDGFYRNEKLTFVKPKKRKERKEERKD